MTRHNHIHRIIFAIIVMLLAILGLLYSRSIESFILISLLLIVAFFREKNVVQSSALILSGLVLWMTLRLTLSISQNLVLLLLVFLLIPSLYNYYLRNGELGSYTSNPYVVFISRRLLAIIPLFIGLSLFTFYLTYAIGNPVDIMIGFSAGDTSATREELIRRFGLDRPLHVQYLDWIWGFLNGDLGVSYQNAAPVSEGINAYLYETIKLQLVALIFSFAFSIVIGMLAAYFHNSPLDTGISSVALIGRSMPIFLVGIILISIFGGRGLGWFPSFGAHAGSQEFSGPPPVWWDENFNGHSLAFWLEFVGYSFRYALDAIEHLILPLLTLTFASMATFSRMTRSSLLEILRQDYILAARANGLSEKMIIWRHALKNVMLPLITLLGLNLGFILGGAPITETVFTWPGLGRYFVQKLQILDFPVILSVSMIITLMVLISNMLTDIAYTRFDPRVKI